MKEDLTTMILEASSPRTWPGENYRICLWDGRYEAIVWTKDDGTRWLRKSFPTRAEAVAWVNKKRK